MKRNPSDSSERSSSFGDLHDLYDELAMTQEAMRQGQKRIERLLRPTPLGYDLDEKRDLLHVQARLDALQVQAEHTAKLVRRITGESPEASASSVDVTTVSVPQEA